MYTFEGFTGKMHWKNEKSSASNCTVPLANLFICTSSIFKGPTEKNELEKWEDLGLQQHCKAERKLGMLQCTWTSFHHGQHVSSGGSKKKKKKKEEDWTEGKKTWYKRILANSSAIWQQAAQTTYSPKTVDPERSLIAALFPSQTINDVVSLGCPS